MLGSFSELATDKYGKFLIREIISKCKAYELKPLVAKHLNSFHDISTTKEGVNVAQEIIRISSEDKKFRKIILTLFHDEKTISDLINDKYGVFSVHKIIELFPYDEITHIIDIILKKFSSLSTSKTYYTHIFIILRQKWCFHFEKSNRGFVQKKKRK